MFKKFLFFFLILIICPLSVFAEILKEIKVSGNDRLSTATIINFSELDLGENISENDLNNSLKKLYKTNFFKNINFTINDGILNIDVIELPIIQEIIFNGIKANKFKEQLKDLISLKEKGPLVESSILNDKNKILNSFKTSGYYFANVATKIEKNLNNSVNLIFDIERGDRASIKKIEFIGDKIFKNRKLLSIITSEEDKFWKFISNKKFIDPGRVNLDKRLLLNFYRENGYYKAKVIDSYSNIINNKDFILTFNIDAGIKYYFGDFKLNLPEDFNEEKFSDLKEKFQNISAQKYNIKFIEDILDQLEIISLNQNYEFIDANISENVINNKVNFEINIIDTKKKYVSKIDILGNNLTSEEFIRDNFIVDEGDPFNKILFNKSINNLRSKGIFKSVEAKVLNPDDELQFIQISVEEKPTGEITAGAGYGSDGSSLGFSVSENNFNGQGINLSTSLSLSEDAIKGSFGFTHPNFAYSDRALSTSIESTSTDKISDFGYKSSLNKFSLGTRYEQFDNLFFSPSFSISNEKIKVTSDASSAYQKQKGTYFDTSFAYGLNFDSRNSSFQPTKGFISYWNQEIPIVSDDQALYNSYNFSNYSELFDDVVLSTSFLIRSINSLSDKDVRVSKRLYIPSSRLRGFASGKVGPKDGNDFIGGNYVSSFNISSTVPYLFQTLENIDLKLFFDAGNVWGVDYSKSINDSSKIRSSTGVAVDLLTPVGPLSFSFAQPLSKESTDQTETFKFQLGTTF